MFTFEIQSASGNKRMTRTALKKKREEEEEKSDMWLSKIPQNNVQTDKKK